MDETMDPVAQDTQAALAATADGTLPAAERARVEREAAASPELARQLERQRNVVAAVRALDVGAPVALRRAVEDAIEASATRSPRVALPRIDGFAALRPRALLASGGALAAVAAAVLVLVLSGGSTSPPTVQEAARVALRSPSAPAPRALPSGDRLAVAVDGIVYPTWSQVGWHAVGQRMDTVGGHAIRTVYYANAKGVRVGYAIADGTALPVAGGRLVTVANGAQLRVMRLADGDQIVTWRRAGHTCILTAGREMPTARLVTLASYET
jgi:anti-sigma factor RsiW